MTSRSERSTTASKSNCEVRFMHLELSSSTGYVPRVFIDSQASNVPRFDCCSQGHSKRGHFRRAGPRERTYFACIVTCGGLCPGLNTVIREIFHSLDCMYGDNEVLGIDGVVDTAKDLESNMIRNPSDEDAVGFMAKDVDIIISSAANTTFDERHDTTLDINTGGPTRLMSFAK
ncbi:ATP-dependent 6-phosphofructokinase 4 chloroplastic [Phtheirospermum japonicum]|uniref:ATP-dependent 6-phosphofructokinase 4 chloroplastic n=1 Tax=Phtheirospermum japonicum TaxID=374723 RepID=A0A830C274_9LAMI|nr:ATP-dependent 6-phosphofructokinase 4 chloroplastic [Phtheirospermum japonicum]